MSIHHIVLMRWKPEATPDQIEAVGHGLRGLSAQIPEIAAYECGDDLAILEGNYDFGLVASFATQDDWQAYRDHPAHQAVIAQAIAPIVAKRAAIQIAG